MHQHVLAGLVTRVLCVLTMNSATTLVASHNTGWVVARVLCADHEPCHHADDVTQHKAGWQNNPDKSTFPTAYNASAPNTFRWVVNRVRAAALGREAAGSARGGIHVWVQPKEMVIGK
jgi:hypothetical protein